MVNHALVTNFNVANMSFNAFRENKVPDLQYIPKVGYVVERLGAFCV